METGNPNLDNDSSREQVDRFILQHIDTVPHLEGLLLLWNSRPRAWNVAEMARALYLPANATKEILEDLLRRGLITRNSAASESYGCEAEGVLDAVMNLLDQTYRRELIRVTRLIHSKASASVREFARAFRLKKENE